ncbi:hypothetical protein V1477_014483 [Vespula maculifrons]|uniref:Uncharacterized protein n=1 Tax=Vespula maculifrons TaxID=7453 RepID=A0ABD2BHK4_VESMC
MYATNNAVNSNDVNSRNLYNKINFIDLPLLSLSCNAIDTLNIKLTEPSFHTSTEVDLIEIDAFWKFVIPNVSGQIIQSVEMKRIEKHKIRSSSLNSENDDVEYFISENNIDEMLNELVLSDSKDLLCNEDFQAYDSYEEVIEFNESNEKYVCDDELQYIRTQQCI